LDSTSINHNYMLCPVSAEARIVKNNASSSLNIGKPRFDLHLTLEKVPLQLSDSQYRHLISFLKSYRKLERNCRLRHYRPYCEVIGNSRQWWDYCVSAVLLAKGYRRRKRCLTMDEALKRAKDIVLYVNAYEKHLQGEFLPNDLQKLKGMQNCVQCLEIFF